MFGAKQHNLKDIDVTIPTGKLVCVTGVSGSGKSTLVNEIVYKSLSNLVNRHAVRPGEHERIEGIEQLDKVIAIDQSPIGRTPRSNPATYTGVFDHIRQLFAQTMEAKVRGYLPGRFSFNVKGGRCEACKGDGTLKIEMHFLPDVYVPCEVCAGKRYNRETLEVRFKGKNIAEVLDMSVEEALEYFSNQPKIARRLQTLYDVGLDYIRLGQPSTTLSGGEAQRVKLATELSKIATGNTLYILDEPTTGLHFADTAKLLEVLQRLVDSGNTVLVIEHNLDVIKCADWVIDLGPEGGNAGGLVVAEGTPEEVALVQGSYTGRFLRRVLSEPVSASPTPGAETQAA
ncbi:MAG: UvrABC system protein A [Actinobacteria bacterium ADurb.Bin444]|nr:MAG: UvrABC system protein A [Actinobacteria bacterium ADurb.Bin444]